MDSGQESIRIVRYASDQETAVIELMAELQDFERSLSRDRSRGAAMARDHFAYLRALCDERSGQVFLALAGSEVIGFAVVFIEAEDEEDRHLLPQYMCYGWLSDLYVKPRFRGRAAGARLVAAATDHCASVGVRQLRLGVLCNNSGARRFYESMGFQPYETVYTIEI